jgi:hypothetical protein
LKVDAVAIRHYLASHMLRKLLTLLAILSGLTAIAAPAQARFSALEGVQVQLASTSSAKCRVQQTAAASMPVSNWARPPVEATPCPGPIVTIVIPTVQLKADRARE